MRILLVTHRFLPRFLAGTEVYTSLLGHGLKELGHTVRVFTGDPSATAAYAYDSDGLAVQAVPWRVGRRAEPVATFLSGFSNPPVEHRFAEVCAEFQPDIVHVQHLLGLSPRLPAISRRHGARVVLTLHDYWFECSNTFLYRYTNELCPGPGIGYHCGGCAQQRLGIKPNALGMALTAPIFVLRTAVLRRVLQSADRIIVPSQVAAKVFAAHAGLADKLRVIPHGLASGASATGGQEEPVHGPRPLRLAYIGSMIRQKGVHIIVQAFCRLPSRDVELHLYGDPSADVSYAEELRRMATRPEVFFHGPLERNQVPDVLRAADLLLVPTLWRETFSVIVDEAFEAGIPVLVSAESAAAERVVAGVNGLVAPAGDVEAWREQLGRLATEPGLLQTLRRGITPPETLAQHTAEIEALYLALARSSSQAKV